MRIRARAVRWGLAILGTQALVFAALVVACGDRSALIAGQSPGTAVADAARDATPDIVASDVRPDASPDVQPDLPPDVAIDMPPDVPVFNCPDAGEVPIYVVSFGSAADPAPPAKLYRFLPSTAAFSLSGEIPCNDNLGNPSLGLAVDREGAVYFELGGDLWELDASTGACETAPFHSTPPISPDFGVAFVTMGVGPGEALYVEDEPVAASVGETYLGRVDTATWKYTRVAPIDWGSNPPPSWVQLAGTTGGNLFGLFLYETGISDNPPHLAQIDVSTGKLLSWVDLRSALVATNAFALRTLAAWGTDLYFFANDGTVTRYTPATGAATVVAMLPGADFIVAAASSCALD